MGVEPDGFVEHLALHAERERKTTAAGALPRAAAGPHPGMLPMDAAIAAVPKGPREGRSGASGDAYRRDHGPGYRAKAAPGTAPRRLEPGL